MPVASLRQLVGSPALNPLIVYLARPRSDPEVEHVALVEDLGGLELVARHAIVLLTHAASATASSYRFDMALRVAGTREVAAIVLSAGHAESITSTSSAIAHRAGIAILATGADVDLAALAIAIGRELAGAADVALLRAHTALRAIDAHPNGGAPEALTSCAGAALGVPLRFVTSKPPEPNASVVVDDHVEGWITAAPQQGDLEMAMEIVLRATASGAAHAIASARREQELPIRSRDEVLTELLSAPPQGRPPIIQRARTLGFPIDDWHVALRLEFEDLTDPEAGQEAAAYEARMRFGRIMLQAMQASGEIWHSARAGQALVLVRSYEADPGIAAATSVAQAFEPALAETRSRLPTTLIRCGVGSAHTGPAGLLSTVTEAHAAVTIARAAGRVNTPVPFDSLGLRRTLVEWYASDTAQEAVTTVLAPLTHLSRARGERLIQTLHVYLDHQGSVSKTAERMNMHRNAVSYRIHQIFELLDVDPENPDDLLLLQLACRARELA
jgi:sugar diacid utilization regulator